MQPLEHFFVQQIIRLLIHWSFEVVMYESSYVQNIIIVFPSEVRSIAIKFVIMRTQARLHALIASIINEWTSFFS